MRISNSANLLYKAFKNSPKQPISKWPDEHGPISIEEGYEISNELFNLLGKQQIGWKVLGTSHIRDKYKIKQPIYGRLFADKIKQSSTIDLHISDFNAPRFEPHFTFKIASDITDSVDYFSIQSKISEMRTSVEISDSRYTTTVENTKSLIGNYVADNSRSGVLVIGDRANWMDMDMATVKGVLYVQKSKIQETQHTDDINPLVTLMDFLNRSLTQNFQIKRGDYISVAMNYPAPQQVRENEEVVTYISGTTEVIVNFKE